MANIASAINGARHLTAIPDAVAAELAALDFGPLLTYIVDAAAPEALYPLAQQFGVLGWKGWNLAKTDRQRRDLIKRAIRLQRYKGTPGAIIDSITALGFPGAEVKEGVGIDYDGTYRHDSAITYSGGTWSNFRVIIIVGNDTPIDEGFTAAARELVLAYKNARSTLVDISFRLALTDRLKFVEILEVNGNEISEYVGNRVRYTGEYLHNGAKTYGTPPEEMRLKIYKNGKLLEDGYTN